MLRLEENYRSSQGILDAASALVAHNEKRKGKTLRAVKAAGEPVRLHQAGDEYQEAQWVVGRISSLRARGRAAVLFRMNAQSRLLEEALMRHGLPYVVVGGVGFYERKEVKDLLAYLRVVRNPADPIALRRILNVPPRGIGARTVEEVERAAAERSISAWDALSAVDDEALLPARATLPLRRFREMIERLRGEAEGLAIKDLLSRILEVTGYSAALAQEDTQESQDRLENLAELLSAAADYETRDEAPTLAGFLDQVSLLSRHRPDPRRCPRHAHDAALRQGTGVRVRVPGRAGGGPLTPHAQPQPSGVARGGAPAALRRDDARHGAAPSQLGVAAGRCSASGASASRAGS